MQEQTTPAPLPTLPNAGGSYTRQPDGTLVKDQPTPAAQAEPAPATETPAQE